MKLKNGICFPEALVQGLSSRYARSWYAGPGWGAGPRGAWMQPRVCDNELSQGHLRTESAFLPQGQAVSQGTGRGGVGKAERLMTPENLQADALGQGPVLRAGTVALGSSAQGEPQ